MYSNDFEKAFGDFLDGNEHDQQQNIIFAMVRSAFAAGWIAAGGKPPKHQRIFQLMPIEKPPGQEPE